MNYTANSRSANPARKPKRVGDVNTIEFTVPNTEPPYMPMSNPNIPLSGNDQTYGVPGQQDFNQFNTNPGNQQYGYHSNMPQQMDHNAYGAYQKPMNNAPQQPPNSMASQFAMFQKPMVQDMAVQYGQRLADQGKELINEKVEKYIPITRLKYYFAVDNKYVINKLRLLFFPFTHKDWALKYNQESPVQPRYDINAPDLYIPSMAYITYVVLAGFVLGMQDRFSPEQLGLQASSALAYSIFEVLVYTITLYVAHIPNTLKTLDLLAYSGYKYSTMVACILISLIFRSTGYYISLIYCGLSLAFFLIRTLKAKMVEVVNKSNDSVPYDAYGQQPIDGFDQTLGRKRKLYFLLLVAGSQPLLCFWLSIHLMPSA